MLKYSEQCRNGVADKDSSFTHTTTVSFDDIRYRLIYMYVFMWQICLLADKNKGLSPHCQI